jgi:hypothetical protein
MAVPFPAVCRRPCKLRPTIWPLMTSANALSASRLEMPATDAAISFCRFGSAARDSRASVWRRRASASSLIVPRSASSASLTCLYEGEQVKIELGRRADDLANHDRPSAKLYGALGPWRMVDDMDRAGRGVAWVPIGPQDEGSVGFYVEADRAAEVIVNHVGGKVRLVDEH